MFASIGFIVVVGVERWLEGCPERHYSVAKVVSHRRQTRHRCMVSGVDARYVSRDLLPDERYSSRQFTLIRGFGERVQMTVVLQDRWHVVYSGGE